MNSFETLKDLTNEEKEKLFEKDTKAIRVFDDIIASVESKISCVKITMESVTEFEWRDWEFYNVNQMLDLTKLTKEKLKEITDCFQNVRDFIENYSGKIKSPNLYSKENFLAAIKRINRKYDDFGKAIEEWKKDGSNEEKCEKAEDKNELFKTKMQKILGIIDELCEILKSVGEKINKNDLP